MFERNKAWQHNMYRTPQQVGWIAASNLAAYHDDVNEKQSRENMLELMETKWKKPTLSSVKTNVDFAAFSMADSYGIGIITRDGIEGFLAARS